MKALVSRVDWMGGRTLRAAMVSRVNWPRGVRKSIFGWWWRVGGLGFVLWFVVWVWRG